MVGASSLGQLLGYSGSVECGVMAESESSGFYYAASWNNLKPYVKVHFPCDTGGGTCQGWIRFANGDLCVKEYAATTSSSEAIKTGQIGPNAIELAEFKGTCTGGAATITWSTASEIDSIGFNVYRAPGPSGPFVLVNDSRIPSVGGPEQGASYDIVDDQVTEDDTYWYRLEEIGVSLSSTFFEPIEVNCPKPPERPPISACAPSATVGTGNRGFDPGAAVNIFAFFLPPAATIALWLRSRRKQEREATIGM